MKKSCVYPGSFDPVTLGHLDIIKRAASMFDEVYVAVGSNSSKSGTLSIQKRLDLIKSVTRYLPNVKTVSFTGLLADFCYESDIKFVIKGVRNFQDFDYERLLNDIGLTQQLGIETITLFSKPELSHVSSSAAKELVKHCGLTDGYVSLVVKQELELTLTERIIVGVTGEIGMGKSFFSKKLLEASQHISEVDLDKIGHDILHNRSEPVYCDLRQSIIKEFGLSNGTSIDRKELGDIVFNDVDALKKLNNMMWNPMLTRIRREIGKFKGVILLNGALLAEAGFLTLCNNNVFLVNAPKEKQLEVLKKRGLSDDQILRRINSQFNNSEKIKSIYHSSLKHDHGKCVEIENIYNNDEVNQLIKRFCENPIDFFKN